MFSRGRSGISVDFVHLVFFLDLVDYVLDISCMESSELLLC